jgi:hypothetical protein
VTLLPPGDPRREEVLALQRRRADAMIRQDIEALGDLLASDLSYTHSDGRTDTRESFLALISGTTLQYVGVDYSNLEAIGFGEAVLVRGLARIRLRRPPDQRLDYPVLFVDLWARRGETWQTIAWQATRAPSAEVPVT